jgi:Abnormal spindle-like microcephaly-assoc'd, ASPM-SPD-2-Hydin/Protein of unknown function (DUF1573)
MGKRSWGPRKCWITSISHRAITMLASIATLASLPWIAGCTGMVDAQNKTGQSAVQVLPASVNFGSTGVGKKVSHAASVTNTGTTAVTLTQAVVSSTDFSISGLQFPLTIQAGQRANFTVWFKGSKAGKSNGKLHFKEGSDSDAPDPVDLTGTAEDSKPNLDLSSSSHDFGKVTVNGIATTALTLTNSGTANLNISKISVTGATFSAAAIKLPAVVPVGGTVALKLTFSPKTPGSYSGDVAVTSDDPDSPTRAVSLTGVGTTEPVGTLTASPAALSFSNVKVGGSASAVTTVRNTGTGNVTLSQIKTSSTAFSATGIAAPVLLVPGESLALTVKFSPTATGTTSGNISLVNTQGGITGVSVSGTAVQPVQLGLSVSPGNINFGNVVANLTNTQTVQISNPGTASVQITASNVTGTGFSASGLSVPLTLNAGQSRTFNVEFNPKAAGGSTGSLTLLSNAPNSPSTIMLSGAGIAAGLTLSVNPGSVSFGNVTANTTASRSVTVTNSGNSSVAISSITLTGAKFLLSGGSAVTLTPSQSITLSVQFTPTATGAASGSISIVSNATGSPASIPVSGTGVIQVQHSVALAWNASGNAAGYNVYRSGTSGSGYVRINSSVDTAVSYSDSTVQSGQTYFYVTTAVDSAGGESAFSSEASANIP